ncbi:MAG TPA: peptidoglycan recognition family protein, partial [Spirochaetota bacterium]|nr:peptidoglycan recognition family protein [Spirochaetota bacterium]
KRCMNTLLKISIIILLLLFTVPGSAENETPPAMIDHSIVTPLREELTRKYALVHYGIDSFTMKDPKIIVVHYTVTHDLRETLNMFSPDTLRNSRPDIAGGGDLNVGVHFTIDKQGKIYSLMPLTMMGRHTIGFNHLSIGIELSE